MKSLNSLAIALVIVGTTLAPAFAHASGSKATAAVDPKVALVSPKNDRVLESAVEALQNRNAKAKVETNATTEPTRPSNSLRHRLHRIHKHAEEHVLILGGPEAFSM
jgi:hypothetical protein